MSVFTQSDFNAQEKDTRYLLKELNDDDGSCAEASIVGAYRLRGKGRWIALVNVRFGDRITVYHHALDECIRALKENKPLFNGEGGGKSMSVVLIR